MNSIFPTLFQFFFLVIVIIAFIAVIKFFRRSLAPKIAKDWQPIALLGVLSVMAFLSTMMYFNFTSSDDTKLQQIQKGERLTEKLNDKERNYLVGIDPDLNNAYAQLESDMETIDTYKIKTYQLNNAYPNHAQFLSKILAYLSQESAEQKKLFNRANREVRNALLQREIQDNVAIDQHFLKRAKLLKASLTKRHKSSKDVIQKKAFSQVAASVNEARRVLVRGRSKKGSKVAKYSFSSETQDRLLVFLSKQGDGEIYTRMMTLKGEINHAVEKRETARNLSMEREDLAAPLIKTMNLWQGLEDSARQHQDELLYAVEAMLLAKEYQMPQHNPPYKALFATLKSQSKRKLARVQKKRNEVGRSFTSLEYVKRAN